MSAQERPMTGDRRPSKTVHDQGPGHWRFCPTAAGCKPPAETLMPVRLKISSVVVARNGKELHRLPADPGGHPEKAPWPLVPKE